MGAPTRSSGVMDVSAGGFGLSRSMLGRHLAVNLLPAAWLNSRSRWKTAGLLSRRKTAGKTAVELAEKTAGKPPENRREKPRFWVTFASLNKGREWLERVSPASFFGPWGGLP